MNLYDPRKRFFYSVVTTMSLAGVYVVFHVATSPLLDVEPQKYSSGLTSPGVVEESSVKSDAATWFPNHSWVKDAREQYFDRGRFLYCNSSELINGNETIILKPVAIRWKDEDAGDHEVPVTLVAESARLDLGSPISEKSAQIGRVSGGAISGQVQINGPRGLKIIGHNFTLAQDSMRLFSSEQVRFEWEGHRGVAASGVDIHLRTDDGSNDLARVAEISRVQLNGRVNCHIMSPAKRKGQDDLDVRISAARGFNYDVLTLTGTFFGKPVQGSSASEVAPTVVPGDEVWVKHLAADGSLNQLVCPELVITLRESVETSAATSEPQRAEVESLRAWGPQVHFFAEQHDLHVDGNDFQYHVIERRIDIRRTADLSSNAARFVNVRRGDSLLKVPHIRILHTQAGDVSRIECNGQGSITATRSQPDADAENSSSSATDKQPATFGAAWRKSLVLQSTPDQTQQTVTLDGSASVSQIERGLKLSAQKIQMKLFTVPGIAVNDEAALPSEAHTGTESAAAIDFGAVQPEVLIASGAVTLDSLQGSGRLREQLTVRFQQPIENPVKAVSDSRDVTDTTTKDSSTGNGMDGLSDNGTQVSFVADTLEATIEISARNGKKRQEATFKDLWLKGDVEVVSQSDKPDNSFTAVGNQLYAANGLNQDRQIQLFGDPARVTSESQNLEGPRIDLQELNGKAEVVGSGRIRFVTATGFDGQPLAQPTPLDIYWSDRMQFQERAAEFVGNIRVVMSDGVTQDLQLLCAGMTVHFSKDVSLGQRSDDGGFEAVTQNTGVDEKDESPIERIECHNRVTVNVEQYQDGVISARHHAVFVDLQVDLISGDFEAIGPGSLESVSPDNNGELQGSAPATARANTSAQTTATAFVHIKTAFIGDFAGNLHRQEATLTQNVLALVTPTRRVDEKINLQQIPRDELPERAGILRAEQLTISAVENSVEVGDSDSAPLMFSIVANENARLESRSLAASADVIVYDHSKEQFIIRAEGSGDVTVHHRSGPDGRFNRFSGNRFEYYRRTNRLKAKEINGLNLGD